MVQGYNSSSSCAGEELGLNVGRGANQRSSLIGHGYPFVDQATVAEFGQERNERYPGAVQGRRTRGGSVFGSHVGDRLEGMTG